ncbi:MAG TPA: phenylalanine--tRNA ligase subunit beta, partial [Thermoanaerobaculia bacterium]|nr:phenylalanine--tRNA ligase subunit beta [Thermoanaerobaculia bacterium]
MLFASEWLARYVDLPADPRETARRLTAAGLAVEQIEEVEGGGVVFDIDVTTNRPDCMNHFGVARELSVLLDRPLRAPSFDVEED